MNIKRLLLLVFICISLLVLTQTGCDELITEQIFTTIAGHPTADFDLDTSSFDIGCAPHTVTFIDLSDGPRDSWLWNFGDDSISTDSTPTHTYYEAGLYTVSLKITDSESEGEDTEVKKRFIYVGTSSAQFTAVPDSECVGIEITFTPVEYGLNKQWQWDFGDGSPLATDSNPTHIYNTPGIYTAMLTVTDTCGSKTDSMTIKAANCPTVLFWADSTSGCIPFTTTFHDTSVPGIGETITQGSESWDFGDGQAASNPQNPTVTYNNSGIYTVSLTVGSTGGTATDSVVDYITVFDTTVASFNIIGDSRGCKTNFQQFQVKFLSNSTGSIDSLKWDFGDSTFLITNDTNVVHAYINPGIYPVTLEAYSTCGIDDTTIIDLVVLSDTLQDTNIVFSIIPPTGDTATTFSFIDSTLIGVITNWTWFVDNNPVPMQASEVSYKFDSLGTYEIKLTISNDCGSATAVDTVIVIAK